MLRVGNRVVKVVLVHQYQRHAGFAQVDGFFYLATIAGVGPGGIAIGADHQILDLWGDVLDKLST